MPASIGQSMNCVVSSKESSKSIKDKVYKLLSYSGKTIFLQNENQIDMATAISGSGPGFIFNLIDALERAAINFEPGGLEVIEGEQLTEALAQIVWSVTESGDVVSLTISIADEIKTWPTPDEGDQNSLTRGQFISYAPQVSVIG